MKTLSLLSNITPKSLGVRYLEQGDERMRIRIDVSLCPDDLIVLSEDFRERYERAPNFNELKSFARKTLGIIISNELSERQHEYEKKQGDEEL